MSCSAATSPPSAPPPAWSLICGSRPAKCSTSATPSCGYVQAPSSKKCTHIITFNLLTFESLLLQLQIFRDHGNRKDRQKARLLWLIEEWGLEAFRQAVLDEMQTNAAHGVGAGQPLPVDKHQHHAGPYAPTHLLSAPTPPDSYLPRHFLSSPHPPPNSHLVHTHTPSQSRPSPGGTTWGCTRRSRRATRGLGCTSPWGASGRLRSTSWAGSRTATAGGGSG